MKKISVIFVAALSLAAFGCKKKSADSGSGSNGNGSASATGGGGDCNSAMSNSMEVSKADLAKMPGVDDKMLAKLHDLGVKHCTDDKWSDDVIKCMTGAKTEAEAQGCYGKLTPEQRDTMNKAAIELTTPPAGAGGAAGAGSDGAAAGSGSAPAAGSDTGSGSAAAK